MNISSLNGAAQVSQNIKELGDMLKNMQGATTDLSGKLMKASVTAKVQGMGENIDVFR